MIDVRPALEADEAAWQAHLARSDQGDFLHDWGWAAVASLDGQPQRRFMAFEDGELVAIAAAQVRRLAFGRTFWYIPHGPVLDYIDVTLLPAALGVVVVSAVRLGKPMFKPSLDLVFIVLGCAFAALPNMNPAIVILVGGVGGAFLLRNKEGPQR